MASRNEPVKHTCPDIDKLVKRIRDIDRYTLDIERASNHIEDESLKGRILDIIGNIQYEVWDFDGKLEELRSANSALRDWGNDLVSEIESLESQLENTK